LYIIITNIVELVMHYKVKVIFTMLRDFHKYI